MIYLTIGIRILLDNAARNFIKFCAVEGDVDYDAADSGSVAGGEEGGAHAHGFNPEKHALLEIFNEACEQKLRYVGTSKVSLGNNCTCCISRHRSLGLCCEAG